MTIHEATVPAVSRAQIARYACVIGDFNPIHVDEQFALAAGMPSVIAHGPLTLALAIDALVAQVGAATLRSLEARLTAPVFPGDDLVLAPADGGAELRKSDGTVAATLTFDLEVGQ